MTYDNTVFIGSAEGNDEGRKIKNTRGKNVDKMAVQTARLKNEIVPGTDNLSAPFLTEMLLAIGTLWVS